MGVTLITIHLTDRLLIYNPVLFRGGSDYLLSINIIN